MTPIEHVAARVVALVTEHAAALVTDELHAGIDLARLLVSGEPVSATGNLLVLNTCGELERRYQQLQLMTGMYV